MAIRVPRELRPLTKAAIEQGWTLSARQNGHLRLDPPADRPDLHPLTLPASPTRDSRAFLNARAVCRRGGIKI